MPGEHAIADGTYGQRQRYIDILINCQGLQVSRIHATTTTEDIQNTTSVNLDQTMIACRAASKALIRGAPDCRLAPWFPAAQHMSVAYKHQLSLSTCQAY